jgi:hypothetical protein
MTECVPKFNFNPGHAFTIGDAAKAAGSDYGSFFSGKWHLGSFYNDSEVEPCAESSLATYDSEAFL